MYSNIEPQTTKNVYDSLDPKTTKNAYDSLEPSTPIMENEIMK